MARFDLEDTKIQNIPLKYIRNFLKKRSFYFLVQDFSTFFDLDEQSTTKLIEDLCEQGFIEHSDGKYETTEKGNSLRMATLLKRIKREKVDSLISDVLCRASYVNSTDDFKIKIVKIILFGSATEVKADYGDVDLIIDWKVKEVGSGINFTDINEIFKFIRARSQYISLHEVDDLSIASSHRVIFRENENIDLSNKQAIQKGLNTLKKREIKKSNKQNSDIDIYIMDTKRSFDFFIDEENKQLKKMIINYKAKSTIEVIYEAKTYMHKEEDFMLEIGSNNVDKEEVTDIIKHLKLELKKKVPVKILRNQIETFIEDFLNDLWEDEHLP